MKKLSKTTLQAIRSALKEDIGSGDITSNLLIPPTAKGIAQIYSKSTGVFAGSASAQAVAKLCGVSMRFFVKEGALLKKNQRVIALSGKIHAILKAERVLLNLIGHLSGIATQTAQFVQKVEGTKCRIIDTRKTTPLWRELEKAAVLAGGGFNHRFGLDDYILVKENHRRFGNLQILGTKKQGPRSKHRKSKPGSWFLVRGSGFEIEVRDFDELMEAFDLGAEVAMLDHFTPAQAKKAVQLRDRISPQTFLEASGNMTLKTVRAYAVAGVDTISVGALTHSVVSHDFSLLIA
ncbi:MAG TPA: carboxylating nicotinate-nucleotide diphosphorylase [Candidatus Omnitrophota bacterium]|nr:carboxylating nicotinate-nucleotide diphosphorylase [Candidatus Omnitrophota bacterium]